MQATLADRICVADAYIPSTLEQGFFENTLSWTSTEKALCEHLNESIVSAWIAQNKGLAAASPEIFSRLCKRGQPMQLLEPLSGLLRDPRVFCSHSPRFLHSHLFLIEHLTLADSIAKQVGARNLFFDAGGSRFTDALAFFANAYALRGIEFDKLFVWEADRQGESYWKGVPAKVRKHWEPRLVFHDGVKVSAVPGDQHNVVTLIYRVCRPLDFCALKLDIDEPLVERALVQQLLSSPGETGAKLDEFFFEHHVHGLAEEWWGHHQVDGTFADSYRLFRQLRELGVRAHSWI